jgi:hypothetical protein
MMADIAITCPHCGVETGYSWTTLVAQCLTKSEATSEANLKQPPKQPPESGANGEIAHVVEVQDLAPKKELSKSTTKGYNQDFLVFWGVYPLRRNKRKAQDSWRRSVRRLEANLGVSRYVAMAEILAGAIRYRDDPNRDDAYTKYAEGWLNGDGWEDEPLPARKRGKSVSNLLALADEVER